jgi:hypothetical protein
MFAIVAGNVGGAFKIAACGGQIRVADAIIDYDLGPRVYNLTVQVTDDGSPSKSTTAVFVIKVGMVAICFEVPHTHSTMGSHKYQSRNMFIEFGAGT